jgi:hypothetical protein
MTIVGKEESSPSRPGGMSRTKVYILAALAILLAVVAGKASRLIPNGGE